MIELIYDVDKQNRREKGAHRLFQVEVETFNTEHANDMLKWDEQSHVFATFCFWHKNEKTNVFITYRFPLSSSAYTPFRTYIAGDGPGSESFEVLHLCEDAGLAKVEKSWAQIVCRCSRPPEKAMRLS